MEKCQFCGIEFSVLSKRAERRLAEFREITGKTGCDGCQKKIREKAQEEIVMGLIKEAMDRRMSADAVDEDVIQKMVEEGDPAVQQLFKGVFTEDGKR